MSMSVSPAFLTGAPGAGEWLVLFVILLILFGPRRLPEFARMMGKALDQLRRAAQEFREHIMEIEAEVEQPSGPGEGPKGPGALSEGQAGGTAGEHEDDANLAG